MYSIHFKRKADLEFERSIIKDMCDTIHPISVEEAVINNMINLLSRKGEIVIRMIDELIEDD